MCQGKERRNITRVSQTMRTGMCTDAEMIEFAGKIVNKIEW